ncbi:MAG: Npt1/Npt2 family nucleotide transporter [Waddliaceae bacterium]
MSDSSSDTQNFGWIRALIWPVHRHELKKLIPMLLLFFFVFFNYNVLRIMKDTLVVTAKSSGAEVIPYIKTYVMLPAAFLMTFVFTRLANRFSREVVFYVMISSFLIYFFLFAFFLYPNHELIHPNELADSLQASLPAGFKGLIAVFRNWTFTLFFVISELWQNIVLFVLVWGFANQVTRLNEAKRFYGLFGFGANFSGIFAGLISVYLCQGGYNSRLPFGRTDWEQTLIILVSLVIFSGILSMLLIRWMYKNVLSDSRYYDYKDAQEDKAVRGKLSIRESFSYILNSKYLIYITLLVVFYNIVNNLTDIVWKNQLNELYPNPRDFSLYAYKVSTVIGIVATFSALIVSGNALRKCGWTFTAMITPCILIVMAIGFFGLFFFKEHLSMFVMSLFGTTPLALVVFVGAFQNVLNRGAKYTVFDATKEMAFVTLPGEWKLKGNSVIDGVSNRFGEFGACSLQTVLLGMFATLPASAPYIATILFFVFAGWIVTVWLLGKEFNLLTSGKNVQPSEAERIVEPERRKTVIAEQQAI